MNPLQRSLGSVFVLLWSSGYLAAAVNGASGVSRSWSSHVRSASTSGSRSIDTSPYACPSVASRSSHAAPVSNRCSVFTVAL